MAKKKYKVKEILPGCYECTNELSDDKNNVWKQKGKNIIITLSKIKTGTVKLTGI